jgi:hypothetical protein
MRLVLFHAVVDGANTLLRLSARGTVQSVPEIKFVGNVRPVYSYHRLYQSEK